MSSVENRIGLSQTIHLDPEKRKFSVQPQFVLAAIFVLGLAAACSDRHIQLKDVTGDGGVTTADWCQITGNDLACADINRDGKVTNIDRDIIAALVGNPTGADSWHDPTGDGKVDCDDLAVVKKHLKEKTPEKAPLEINGMSNQRLATGWYADRLRIRFDEGTPRDTIEDFLRENSFEEIEEGDPRLQNQIPELVEVRVPTDDLDSLISKLSKNPIIDTVEKANPPRGIVDFPATPVKDCGQNNT